MQQKSVKKNPALTTYILNMKKGNEARGILPVPPIRKKVSLYF